MGVNTKSFDNASDMITFSRASGAYGFTKVGYGSELVTNIENQDQLYGVSAVYPNSTSINITNISGGVNLARVDLPTVIGKTYIATGEMFAPSSNSLVGIARVSWGSTVLVNVDDTWVPYSLSFTATSTITQLSFQSANGGSGGGAGDQSYFRNVSVKEVLYNSSAADATLQLIYHPENKPRIEYNTDGTAKGLLVEEARTNLIVNSEDFTAASWASKVQHTGQANAAISPAGTQTATRITSTGVDPHIFQFTPVTAGNDYVLTVWLRGIGNTVGRAPRVWFINNSGTISSTFDSTPLTNSWQKYTVTGSCTGSGSVLTRIDFDDSGLSANGEQIDVWGAQVEAGTFPTSYIKTTGATATRAVDVATIGVGEFGHNKTAGALLVETSAYEGSPFLLVLSSGSDTNRAQIRASASNISGYVQSTGDSGSFLAVSGAPIVPFKTSMGFKTDDIGLTVNGGPVSTDTSQNIPVSITKLNIGSSAINQVSGKIHIKSITYYPRRLTDAQIQELTT